MKLNILIFSLVFALIWAAGTQFALSEEEKDLDAAKIMGQLEQIISNQDKILNQFEEIKQELAIIKIRASR